MQRHRSFLRVICLLLATALIATTGVAVAASTPQARTAKSATGLTLAKQNLKALYSGSFFRNPPTTSPRPQRGKDVWIIALGLGCETCQSWTKQIQTASKTLGWKTHVYDAKFTPSRYLDGIRQAIAAKADGMIFIAIDCAPVKAALQEARKAGIKVSTLESADCSDQNPSAKSLFNASVIYNQGAKALSFTQFQRALGTAQADWIAAKTGGKANIVAFKNTDSFVNVLSYNGMVAELKRVCTGCKIQERVDFVQADLLGSTLRQKIEQGILKNPDANVLTFPYADVLTGGGIQAISSSGRNLLVVASGGGRPGMTLIRENKGLDAGFGLATDWESWAAVDGLNRAFAGQKAQPSGIGVGMIDRTHNVTKGTFRPPVNYVALYKKAWGVK